MAYEMGVLGITSDVKLILEIVTKPTAHRLSPGGYSFLLEVGRVPWHAEYSMSCKVDLVCKKKDVFCQIYFVKGEKQK